MIVANLATYPPRRAHLREIVRRLAPQVGRLNVVLNEYAEAPPELGEFPNVVPLIPPSDCKDTGKFLPDVSGAEFVLLVDDDMLYPPDYVAATLAAFTALGRSDIVGGYHASCYRRTRSIFDPLGRRRIASPGFPVFYRRVSDFRRGRKEAVIVDQLATNTLIIPARHMPPFEFMRSAQKFVDVRLSLWAHEKSLQLVELPRPSGWIGDLRYPETIYRSFTRRSPAEATAEILTFAFRVPHSGRPLRTLLP